jgi:hypothetical protein
MCVLNVLERHTLEACHQEPFFIKEDTPLPHGRMWFRPNGYITGTAPREITWECFSVNGSWSAQEAVQQSLLRYAMDRGKQWAESNAEPTQIFHCFGKLDGETNCKNPNIGLQCHVIMCSHDYTSLDIAQPAGRDLQALICLRLQTIWFLHCYEDMYLWVWFEVPWACVPSSHYIEIIELSDQQKC